MTEYKTALDCYENEWNQRENHRRRSDKYLDIDNIIPINI